MKWISFKDKKPGDGIIVAITGGRQELKNDPVEFVEIVLLRKCEEFEPGWLSMDSTIEYYFPENEEDHWRTIYYWMKWEDFEFPEEFIISNFHRINEQLLGKKE